MNIILGIESSCDETAIAIYNGENNSILSHQLHSQIKTHAKYGGVVPELASRDHIQKITPLFHAALDEANINKSDIDGICYTKGPGLIGALLVGAGFAKSLAYGLNIPSLGVHHLEAHLLAPMLEENHPEFPFLALLVSGGHTMIVEVKSLGNYNILGTTLDDAAGEAFDKTAKLLELGYPGGPILEELAKSGNLEKAENFNLPRPLANKNTLNFSFSGLKTAVLNAKTNNMKNSSKADLALAFQIAAIDSLVIKTKKALEKTNLKQLVIAGGVSANKYLRKQFNLLEQKNNIKVFYPRFEYCTDNAAMVAYTGYRRFKLNQFDKDTAIDVKARWPIEELSSI